MKFITFSVLIINMMMSHGFSESKDDDLVKLDWGSINKYIDQDRTPGIRDFRRMFLSDARLNELKLKSSIVVDTGSLIGMGMGEKQQQYRLIVRDRSIRDVVSLISGLTRLTTRDFAEVTLVQASSIVRMHPEGFQKKEWETILLAPGDILYLSSL